MRSPSRIRQIAGNSARLSRMVWRERRGTVLGLGGLFLVMAATPMLRAGAIGLLLNELVLSAGKSVVSTRFSLVVALVVATNVLPPLVLAIQTYLSQMLLFHLEKQLEMLIIEKKGEIDLAVHEQPSQNDLINRVQENGVFRVQWFVNRQFVILQNVVEVVVASVILAIANWWLFVALLGVTLPELVTEIQYGRMVWSIHVGRAEIRRRFLELRSHFFHLPSLLELKLLQNTGAFAGQMRRLFGVFLVEEQRGEQRKLGRQLGSLVLSQAGVAAATCWFLLRVVDGDLAIGTLVFLLTSIGSFRLALSSLFTNLGRQYQDSLFVADVFRFLDIAPVLTRPRAPLCLASNRALSIAFEGVSFRYPGTRRDALQDISLEIRPGERIAIVGANGSGKTTLVKLLCRFYDPDGGRILIDGHDLRDLDIPSWSGKLGVLFQDYANYRFPVAEAIAVGRLELGAAPERVTRAAIQGEAHEFITRWPSGYDQPLGKEFADGIEPSIGQWQRLALARLFFRDPQVLVLDEPTSSIDPDAEAKLFRQLGSLPADRTVILISHRFSTVRHADRICILDGGRIAELGSHEELLRRGETYARLFELQASSYR
jgi:ATP-binding cassette subfamily B protein